MKIVLPDTNIVLWTFNGGIDFREAIISAAPDHQIMIPTCVLKELKKLGNRKSIAALVFCEKIETIDIGKGYTDKLLIKAAKKGHLIATNDKEMLNHLKREGINALRVREKNKLIMTEGQ